MPLAWPILPTSLFFDASNKDSLSLSLSLSPYQNQGFVKAWSILRCEFSISLSLCVHTDICQNQGFFSGDVDHYIHGYKNQGFFCET